MQLRLNLRQILLQKYDVLDCRSTKLSLGISEISLTQDYDTMLKKSRSTYHKTLALEFLSIQKVLHSTTLKSHQLSNKIVATIRKDNYFLLIDYFTNTILLSNKNKNLIKPSSSFILKNYLVVSENPISFTSTVIKNRVGTR